MKKNTSSAVPLAVRIFFTLLFATTVWSQKSAETTAPSPRRKSIDSFNKPVPVRITAAQFRVTCLPQLINTYGITAGRVVQLKKHILTTAGHATVSADHVPDQREYKVMLTLDDMLFLSTPASNPIPSVVTKIPGRKTGDIFRARLFPTGVRHTSEMLIHNRKTSVTCEMHMHWDSTAPTPSQLLTAFQNGTAFYVLLPTGPEKLPTLYIVAIK